MSGSWGTCDMWKTGDRQSLWQTGSTYIVFLPARSPWKGMHRTTRTPNFKTGPASNTGFFLTVMSTTSREHYYQNENNEIIWRDWSSRQTIYLRDNFIGWDWPCRTASVAKRKHQLHSTTLLGLPIEILNIAKAEVPRSKNRTPLKTSAS